MNAHSAKGSVLNLQYAHEQALENHQHDLIALQLQVQTLLHQHLSGPPQPREALVLMNTQLDSLWKQIRREQERVYILRISHSINNQVVSNEG
jgi:hypothetical protein